MLNLFDNVSYLIDLFKGVRRAPCLGFLNFQKTHHKNALLSFDLQVRKDIFANINGLFLTANPLPYREFRSFISGERAINPVMYVSNCVTVSIKNRNPRIKNSAFLSFIFVNAKISIAIKKSCQPLKKFNCWLFDKAIKNDLFRNWKGIFKAREAVGECSTKLSSFLSRKDQIILEYKELCVFDDTVGRNGVNEGNGLVSVGGYYPRPRWFSFVSFSGIYVTPKLGLKKIGHLFVRHLGAYMKASIFIKSNIALCVKQSSKVMHKTHWLGKLHFTKPNNCPQRLNSMEQGSILCYAIV